MNFAPVRTVADLETLDDDEIAAGFMDGYRDPDAPEPGPNRGRGYWHGWRCAMMDLRKIEIDAVHQQLVHEVVSTDYLARTIAEHKKRLGL
jgi:hypothetical protein